MKGSSRKDGRKADHGFRCANPPRMWQASNKSFYSV